MSIKNKVLFVSIAGTIGFVFGGLALAQTAVDNLVPFSVLPLGNTSQPAVNSVGTQPSSAPSLPKVPADKLISPTTTGSQSNTSQPPAGASSSVTKCGVNTFVVSNECGIGAFKNLYAQCYDGYEEKQGGDSSCKSSPVWQEYAKQTCEKRCSSAKQMYAEPVKTVPGATQVSPVSPTTNYNKPAPTSAGTISVCYINNDLMAQYDALISELQKAQQTGDREREKLTTEKILELKQRVSGSKVQCNASITSSATISPVAGPVKIDRCAEVENWGQKISYYEKLKNLSDSDLQKEAAFSRKEINDIISELIGGLEKVKAQCKIQSSGGGASTATKISEPVKPVAVQSAQEINSYYKAKIESITATPNAQKQVQELKDLKEAKDQLVGELIKNRKEIEATELNTVATEVNVSKNEVRVGSVTVETTGKKILLNVSGRPISVEPAGDRVIIKDQNMDIRTDSVSIQDNLLKVGNVEVKVTASQVAEKLNIAPKAVELTVENSRPVYKMTAAEPRKLFGLIPVNAQKTQVADAGNGELLEESHSWYYFLTTK